MKPRTRKSLIKELDTVFSLFIRQRDKRCVLCGTQRNLTCGHLLSRVAHSTRWDEVNCHCQCAGCNLTHEHYPHKFTQWFLRKYGPERYDLLIAKHNRTAKYTNGDLMCLIKHYQLKLQRREQ